MTTLSYSYLVATMYSWIGFLINQGLPTRMQGGCMILMVPAMRSSTEFRTGQHTAGTKVALTPGARKSFSQTSNPNRAIRFSTSIEKSPVVLATIPLNSALRNIIALAGWYRRYISFIVWTQTASFKVEKAGEYGKALRASSRLFWNR